MKIIRNNTFNPNLVLKFLFKHPDTKNINPLLGPIARDVVHQREGARNLGIGLLKGKLKNSR